MRRIPRSPQQIAIGQHRGAGRDAGRGRDALAQPLVAIEAEPARRGAVPGDDIDLGVGEEFGGAQDLAVVELPQRLLRERDLGHLEAREMHRRHPGCPASIAMVIGSSAVFDDGVSMPSRVMLHPQAAVVIVDPDPLQTGSLRL